MIQIERARAMRWLLASAGIVVAASASAQEVAPAAPAEIVVTGSRIPRLNDKSTSPVTTVGSEEIKLKGTTHVEDLLNALPQVNAGLNGSALGPTGTATVDLRGFGAFRTLVLIDGRRLNPGDPINPSADLNSVPAALVKRVEVLTGGASSIYGSDAVAGVVNFVMDRDFTGLRIDAQNSLFVTSNSDGRVQGLANASGFPAASGNAYDGASNEITATYGRGFAGGAGHIEVYGGYRLTQSIAGNQRDYSACNLTETDTYYACLRNDNTAVAQFNQALTIDPATGNTLRPYDNLRDGFNTSPYQYLQRPDERYDAGFFAHYKFAKALDFYTEGQFSQDYTTAQYEPASTEGNAFGINCNNPLLSADEAAQLCQGLAPTDTAQVSIGRRNIEGRPRLDDFRHTSYRVVVGLKGDLSKVWSYDLYGQYGITRSRETISDDLSLTRLGNALTVVSVGGVPTCQSVVDGTDPACVPYNIFQNGGVTRAAENYISAAGSLHGYAEREVVSGVLIGQLGNYGIKSPFADEGVGIVAGGEYRVETIANTPDAVFVNGDLASTSPQLPIQGTYSVYEFFGEAHVPLVADKPFFHRLALDLSDRYARYSLQGVANAYKVGADWSPIADFTLRANLSRAVRAPNGHELFLANTLAKFTGQDPCAGALPTASAAQCANSGVTAAQYGNIPDTGNFNVLTGGNLKLRPETADTITLGGVITPTFLRGFNFSVDYWRISVKTYVGQYSPISTLNNCISNNTFCNLVQRDAGGSLSLGNGLGAGRVIATNLNTGSFTQSGLDFSGTYGLGLDTLGLHGAGRLSFNFVGSLALDTHIQPVPGDVIFNCVGFYGPICTGEGPTSPIPRWRNQLRVTWAAPSIVELSLNWRHISALSAEATSSSPHLNGTVYPADARIAPYDYFDLAASFDITEKYSLRVGVNNIADRRSPLVGSNANPQILGGNQVASIYDTLGRYAFVGLTLKL